MLADEMRAVLAAVDDAAGRFACLGGLAEPQTGDWWLVLHDRTRGTDHQVQDYARFLQTFPHLEEPATAVLLPDYPAADMTWEEVVGLLPQIEQAAPRVRLDKIILAAHGGYAVGVRDGRTGRGRFLCRPTDLGADTGRERGHKP